MTRSGSAPLYDDDFFAWTQDQAAALRDIAPSAAGRIDIANVATEIEDLGRRDLREVSSFLTRLLEDLIKIRSHSGSPDKAHWISECGHFQNSASDAYTPSMEQLIDVETLWRRGANRAKRSLQEAGVAAITPERCPFSLEELLAEDFSIDSALPRIVRP